ncbi:hypothetical protein DPMN_059404 [Dreissena polymorpha]|uniref:SRCR domain-containing protein n=1 Tax=Dreissena polymorpha TaxID=45954 RepID=A0A9D4C3F8_DREPO|nr:hypothetical protein DPMN_059404 [Dreissena polymorpha]
MLWRLQCHGQKTNLSECWSRCIEPEAVLCGHSQDVSVSCSEWIVNVCVCFEVYDVLPRQRLHYVKTRSES